MVGRKLAVFLIVLWLVTIASPVNAVEKIIKIGGDHQYPPYEFLDEAGNYRGFNVDIMHAIALDQGFTAEFFPMGWDDAQEALLENKIDLIQGMSYSSLRAEIYDFCQPTVTNSQAIFVSRNVHTVASLGDLEGLRVGVEYGDISVELLSSYSKVNTIKFQTQDEAMQALIKGEIDAFVGNELTGWYLLEKWRRLEAYKQVGESLYPTRYGPVVLKGNEKIARIIDQGMVNIKANGTYDKIYRKWFGQTRINYARWMKIGLALLALVVLIVLIVLQINRRLKQEVKRRTEEIEAYSRTQRVILDNTPSGIIIVSPEGIIENSNPAGIFLLGGRASGLATEEIPLLRFLTREEIARILDSNHGLERQIDWNGNSFQVKVSPLAEGDARLLINISDITAQRRLAEQEFEQAKVKALTTLVAGLAHEIRNPLTAVKTFVELVPLKIKNPVFQKRLLEVLPHELGRIEQLVQELLEYARHREAKPRLCRLEETLAPVVDLLAIECERKVIRFTADLPGTVICDPQHLIQIVLNLGLNSLKAVDEGGRIDLTAVRIAEKTRITVADDGCGIPGQYYSQVFDPFFSLQGGTGMGLALVAQMVDENHGRITFQSEENQGTRFHIWLPAGQGEVSDEA